MNDRLNAVPRPARARALGQAKGRRRRLEPAPSGRWRCPSAVIRRQPGLAPWSRPWRRLAPYSRQRSGDVHDRRPRPAAKTVTIPEGYDRKQIAEIAKQTGLRGDYLKASESFKGFDPAKYGAQDPQSLEGFLFPATYELPSRPTAEDLVARQLDAFEQNISQVNMGYARSKNLTTYDVVIIASMIEREVQVPKERALVAAVIYNRLHGGMPLQIDATVRYASGNFTEPISPVRARDRLAVQHLRELWAAARTDRQPRPRLDRGRGASGPGSLPVLRGEARTPAASTPSPPPRPSSAGPRRHTTRRGPRTAATRPPPPTARDAQAARRPRPAGLALALAGDAQRGARRARARRRVVLRGDRGFARRTSRRCVRAMPGEGFVGANVTVPHKVAALELADEASEAARAIGAANTLSFAAGADRRREHRRPGLPGLAPGTAGGQARPGARRGRLGPRGGLGAGHGGRRGVDLEPDAREGRAPGGRVGASALASGDERLTPADFDLIVNTTTVGMGTPGEGPAALKSLPIGADSLGETHQLVDLAYGPAETELARAARAHGATVVDGLEVLVRQGAASLRIWTGQDPPIETMRRAARAR